MAISETTPTARDILGAETPAEGPSGHPADAGSPENWSVYIAACADGSLYTGIARDVTARIQQHNAGTGARYTRSRRPVTLVWQETAASRADALRREYGIKALPAARKRELVRRGALG